MNPKEQARKALEQIMEDNTMPFHVRSCEKIGDLSQDIVLYYADSFMEQARGLNGRFLQEFSKLHNCAVTYGYRGYSPYKNNGIVDIKETDVNLLKDCERLLTDRIIDKYGLNKGSLKPVKVVAHVPAGNRLIGVLDRTQKEGSHIVVLLGISNYCGRVK